MPFALIRIGENIAYITKRIDRIFPTRKHPALQMRAMEDFCQLENRLTEDKYRGSYERCAKIVMLYSERPGLDLSELYLRVMFSCVVGNSDRHLKNFSQIETAERSGRDLFSEAYDMLPVSCIIPNDPEELALALNGKKRNIRRKDFLAFAEAAGLSKKAAEKMLCKAASMQETYAPMCVESLIPDAMKERMIELIAERVKIIEA